MEQFARPLVVEDTAQQWLFEQRRQDPAARRVLLVDMVQSGCSGWAYRPSWSDEVPDGDYVVTTVEHHDDRLLVAYSVQYADKLQDVRLRYVREGLSSRLVFDNPQVSDACGCGASVHFAKAAA